MMELLILKQSFPRAVRVRSFELDVFEVDVVISSRREARAAADVPRPTSGREYAGFFYFHEVRYRP